MFAFERRTVLLLTETRFGKEKVLMLRIWFSRLAFGEFYCELQWQNLINAPSQRTRSCASNGSNF